MFYEIEDKNLSRTILKTRRRILEISYRLFCSEGIFKTSMVDIARELGVTRRTLYNHYNTKEEIAVTLHRLLIQDILNNCRHSLDPEDMTKEGIRSCFHALFSSLAGDRERLAFIINFDQYAQEHGELIDDGDMFVNYLVTNSNMVEYLSSVKKKGLFRNPKVRPVLLARIYFESLIAYMGRVIFREKAYRQEGVPWNAGFESLLDYLLSGISGGDD